MQHVEHVAIVEVNPAPACRSDQGRSKLQARLVSDCQDKANGPRPGTDWYL